MNDEQPSIEPQKAPRAAKWLTLLLGAGFTVMLLLKINTAMSQQSAIARQQQESAKAGAKASSTESGPRTVQGTAERWKPRVQLEGTLTPARESDIAFKVGGRLAQIHGKVGDTVRAGAVLAALEATEARAQERAAAAQVKAAEAQLALAQDSERRMSKMRTAGAISDVSSVQATGQLHLAEAQLESATAQAALAAANVASHQLAAPFAGTLTRAPSAPGAILGPGLPLFHLSDVSELKLIATVGENDAALVRVGARVAVIVEGRTLAGVVSAVLPALDPATRRVPVEAALKNTPDMAVHAGAFVRAVLEGEAAIDVLRYPAAILRPGSEDEVLVEGSAEPRRIAYAIDRDGTLLVRDGLRAEDKVLLARADGAPAAGPAPAVEAVR